MAERDAFIEDVKFNNANRDIVVQNELCLLLFNKPELLGFYNCLQWANQIGLISYIPQKVLAHYLGLTEPTFIKRRRELESLKLLEVATNNNIRTYKFRYVSRLPYFKPPKGLNEIPKYLKDAISSLRIGKSQAEISFTPYKAKKTNGKKFPKSDYDRVVRAYQKYKGVSLKGNEANICYRATTEMFKSGRTIPQIIKFMQWLSLEETQDKYAWTKLWTPWTVQKKLPEFVAGKLGNKKKRSIENERV